MTREDELREINEAIYAGQNAYNAICEAERHLSNARGFGIWDMFGGGFISGLLKHSQMDKAQHFVDETRAALQCFQRELQDINMSMDYAVSFDGAVKAIDILFDNFIVDALIQSRIKETQRNLAYTKVQVQDALTRLQQMRDNLR